jgi:uncharacterized protein YeaO (DUF488 family)
MGLSVVRLGAPRKPGEGVRVGTVRRPPRGVPKTAYAARDYFDVWLPELAPSTQLFAWVRSKPLTAARWATFARRYRQEMRQPTARRLIELLAALSADTNLSVGCYCEDEARCHRSILAQLLIEQGAER